MNVTTGLFYIFSTVLLIAAFRVITARNPVHAVLFLVLTFFQGAMIWMLLKAEFLSIVLVLVYVLRELNEVRAISLRRASKQERTLYAQNTH